MAVIPFIKRRIMTIDTGYASSFQAQCVNNVFNDSFSILFMDFSLMRKIIL